MLVKITSRRTEIPKALRERAEAVVARLARLAIRPTSAHVTFSEENQRAHAEIVLNAARGAVHVATAEAADHRTALDRASAKVRRQLDKLATTPKHRTRKVAAR
ncbi:MAG TPA: ribosome-associated translation inhibitor RaiA [Gemmatimonadales bacterium]|nr:ribosome-associated translation inhibitor RaiA [Gemmatimonadales bacterium]